MKVFRIDTRAGKVGLTVVDSSIWGENRIIIVIWLLKYQVASLFQGTYEAAIFVFLSAFARTWVVSTDDFLIAQPVASYLPVPSSSISPQESGN